MIQRALSDDKQAITSATSWPRQREGRLGDDAQIAKSGELPPKALVRVDAIRKACLTNLDCALDCLFTEV